MTTKKKPVLCLDFDGVLHKYGSGWHGATEIRDDPVDGAMDFLAEAVEQFDVQIYSSRSGQEGGIEAMQTWLQAWLLDRFGPGDVYASTWMGIKWPTQNPRFFLPSTIGLSNLLGNGHRRRPC